MDVAISIEALACVRRWWFANENRTSYDMSNIVDDLYDKSKSAAAAWSILDGPGNLRDAHFAGGPLVALRLVAEGDPNSPDRLTVIDLRIG